MLAACVLASCAARASTVHDPNTLISLVRTDGATMNPLFSQTVEDALVYNALVFESLTYIGADYLPHPLLATQWSHSPDGKEWTVDLRRGVRWSDGQPLTSKDVVFSYEALSDPKTASINYGDLQAVKRVWAEGPYRVHFQLAGPNAEFVDSLMGNEAMILPEHILGKVAHDRLRFTGFGQHPVGSGPYMLQRWQHDSQIEFVRNPYAWRRPHIDRIVIYTIFNDQSEMEAVANGSADLIDDLSSTQYRELQRIAPHVVLHTFGSVYIDVTTPNLRRPGLDDPVVRRAMMYGQDRKAVVDGLFAGLVPVVDNLIPPALTHWYNPHVVKYPYDPAKARALLDADGWKPGPDGVRRRGKTRLSFELLLNQGSATQTDEMLTIVADMKDIGVDLRLRQLDFPSMVSREFEGNFDLAAEGFGGSTDPDLTSVLATQSFAPAGGNTTRFSNPAADRLMAAGVRELDDAKRRVIYDKLQALVAEQVPYFYQYGRFAGVASAQRVDFGPRGLLQSPLCYFDVEDWSLRP